MSTSIAPPTSAAFLLAPIQAAGEQGLSLAEIASRWPSLAPRTVQRWLRQLAESGAIVGWGDARARRYFAALEPAQATETSDGGAGGFLGAIALSIDSQDIVRYVDQPIAARKPVGYELDFLAAYQPNKSAYLTPSLRRQLHRIGQTDQEQAPAGTYGRAILNRLLIDLSWASSHLEGNTYSRLDTVALLEQGVAAQGKAATETQMILNHKAAIELLLDNAASPMNRYLLMNLHSTLAENLLPNPADEGRIRQHAVDIGMSVYRPLAVPLQIDAQLTVLLDKASQIEDPFEQSFFMLVHLPYLQPFADINKRTSRLAANLPLFRANLCPLTFVGVPVAAYSQAVLGVYEMTRVELLRDVYAWAYQRSAQDYAAIRQELAEPDPMRLAYRDLIKRVVQQAVLTPNEDPLVLIGRNVAKQVPAKQRADVQALAIQELSRLHEGVLARYGLRPSQFTVWRKKQALR